MAWSRSLFPSYSLRYVYKADKLVTLHMAHSDNMSSLEEFELGQESLAIFLEHFKKIASQCDEQLKQLLLQSVDRFQNLWPKITKKIGFKKTNGDGQIVGSLLLMDHVDYQMIECRDAVLVAWWGLDQNALDMDEKRAIKVRWSELIRELSGGCRPTVALVHDINQVGQKFAKNMGFQLCGGSLRMEI